jgi:hypothetical protein
MINEETNLEWDDDVLQPAEVAATDSGKAQHAGIEIPIGHVLIVALDANGAEIPGSEFFYPERTYPRFYSDDTRFLIKKKL